MVYEREILTRIRKWIPREEIIILTGPKQSGKTTLLKIIESELNRNKAKVIFINLEDLEIVDLLNKAPTNLFKLFKSTEKIIAVIDEIQYLKNPTNFLKLLYDDFRQKIKLIVSGSSAFYLDKKFKDSLAGRKKIFHILSLSFNDFLIFKQREQLKDIFFRFASFNTGSDASTGIIEKRELNILIGDYIVFGGYPKVALENDKEMKLEILAEIVNSYIKKDIVESDTRYQEKFLALLKTLSSQIGSLFNGNELASTLDLSTTAIANYLCIMQMFENFIFKTLGDNFGDDSLNFWRSQSQSEVDFILESEKKAIEVKYNISTFKLKKYLNFLDNYPNFDFFLFYRDGFAKMTDARVKLKRI